MFQQVFNMKYEPPNCEKIKGQLNGWPICYIGACKGGNFDNIIQYFCVQSDVLHQLQIRFATKSQKDILQWNAIK